MRTHDLNEWRYDHVFDTGNVGGARRTPLVVEVTARMMIIAGGYLTRWAERLRSAQGPDFWR